MLAGAWFAGVTRVLGRQRIAAAAVVLVGVAIVGLDIGNGSFDALGTARLRFGVDVAGSGTLKLARSVVADARASRTVTPDPAPDSPHRQLIALGDAYPGRSILVLLAESWGYARDAALTRYVAAPLVALDGHGYEIRVGAREFKGATTAAELRVLCGLVGDYRVLLAGAVPAECAPAASAAQGRPAVAVHSFRGGMFERATWWPRIGFGETLFEPELSARGVPRCGGPFAGSCDREALAVVRAALAGPPRFVYFLTLNTHLPLHARTTVDPALADLCERDRVPADVCQLTAEQAALMTDVAAMLRSLPVPPVVMITGDHSPPYGSLDARNAFDPAVVPLVVGIPATPRS